MNTSSTKAEATTFTTPTSTTTCPSDDNVVTITNESTTTTSSANTFSRISSNNNSNNNNNNNNNNIVLPRNNKEYGTKEYWEHRFQFEESFEWLVSYKQIQHQIQPILLQYCKTKRISCSNPNTTKDDDTQLSSQQQSPSFTEEEYDKSNVKLLIVGCGNSPFSADLYDDGYINIINIDYSSTVIHNMEQVHTKQRPYMKWMVMDMTQIDTSTYPSLLQRHSFDVVIDKAAMDALLTQEQDVWSPNITVIQSVYNMCYAISNNLLHPNYGTFIQISLSQPHFRNKYLLHIHRVTDDDDENDNAEDVKNVSSITTTKTNNTNTMDGSLYPNYCPQFDWTLQYEKAGTIEEAGMFGHYIYIMRKGLPRSPKIHTTA